MQCNLLDAHRHGPAQVYILLIVWLIRVQVLYVDHGGVSLSVGLGGGLEFKALTIGDGTVEKVHVAPDLGRLG
jgi:hypothetical protein